MNQEIAKAVKVLKNGGIVIFPTDTTFVIGCRMDKEQVVERLFRIRKRPITQATPVLVNSIQMAQSYLSSIPEVVIDKLIKPYWPGALTVVLACKKEKVPSLVRGGGENLGVRMPKHPAVLELIKGVGVPILGPSANFHGERTPYKFEDLDKELIRLCDYVVKAHVGSVGKSSTVIECSKRPWKVLRKGAIKLAFSF